MKYNQDFEAKQAAFVEEIKVDKTQSYSSADMANAMYSAKIKRSEQQLLLRHGSIIVSLIIILSSLLTFFELGRKRAAAAKTSE